MAKEQIRHTRKVRYILSYGVSTSETVYTREYRMLKDAKELFKKIKYRPHNVIWMYILEEVVDTKIFQDENNNIETKNYTKSTMIDEYTLSK